MSFGEETAWKQSFHRHFLLFSPGYRMSFKKVQSEVPVIGSTRKNGTNYR